MSTKAEQIAAVLLANPGKSRDELAKLVKETGVETSNSTIDQTKRKLVSEGKLPASTRGRKPKNADPNAPRAERKPSVKKTIPIVHAQASVENSQPVAILCSEKGCGIAAPECIEVVNNRLAAERLEFVAKAARDGAVAGLSGDCKRCISEALAILGL